MNRWNGYQVTRNTACLVIVVFSDEVVEILFLLLCLDRYLVCLVVIDTHPELVKKI